jgi:hypothetical protein
MNWSMLLLLRTLLRLLIPINLEAYKENLQHFATKEFFKMWNIKTVYFYFHFFYFRNFPWRYSFPQPKDIIVSLGLLAFVCFFMGGELAHCTNPILGDQDFLSGLSPLAFGVPTPLLQGNKICNPRHGPLQSAISRSQPNPGFFSRLLLLPLLLSQPGLGPAITELTVYWKN